MSMEQYAQESSVLINWSDESTSGVIADKDIICHGSAPNGLSILLYQFHQLLNQICDSATYLVSLYDSEKNNFTHHSFPDTEHQFRPVPEMIGESDKKKIRKELVFIEKVFNLCRMLFLSQEEIEALYSDEQNAPACYPKLLIGMPLNADGKIIGVLSVQSFIDSFHLENKIPLLTSVANTMALSVHLRINSEREKKSLALQVIRSQKYEAMGIVIGGITHNFNNILMCIIADAQKGESLSGNQEIKDRFGKICQVARKAAGISKLLVDFSKPDPKVQHEFFSLNDVIKEVLSLVRSCFPVSIQIKEELDPGIEIIIGNPCQIQQVLMNLLVNAYQAIPNSNGDIRIKTSNRILKEQSAENGGLLPGRYLELTIKDNGSGMDETTLKNLFTPFFSTKKEIGGCGLGLSTTLYIIQNHNGHIHATSKPGKGSTFKILFPAINERISLQI